MWFPHGHSKIVTKLNESCGIEVNGNLKCWRFEKDRVSIGFNYEGHNPPQGTFTAISIGERNVPFACALDTSGRVQCWGGYSDETPEVPDEIARIQITK